MMNDEEYIRLFIWIFDIHKDDIKSLINEDINSNIL